MLEDKLLIRRFKCGRPDAAHRIYEKYKDDMLTLAAALSGDRSMAEDIVHNVFVSLARQIASFELRGSLKSYLCTCVANSARNVWKHKQRCQLGLDETLPLSCSRPGPAEIAERDDQFRFLLQQLEVLPYEQTEVLMLHLKGEMKFADIAALQNVSINTVQSRYRYGLDKLRSLLNGQVDL